MSRAAFRWRIKGGELVLGERTLVMGIVNATPDSFFDGGRYAAFETALSQALKLAEEGADILDIGGESTRPASEGTPLQEELDRTIPLIERLAKETELPISIDTKKAAVAEAAISAGARIVNDISGGRADPDILRVAAEAGAGLVLMHMRGTPANMQTLTDYDDLCGEIGSELTEVAEAARAAGVQREAIVLDPGIGFAKKPTQNLALISGLGRFAELGYPLLYGPSRKSFIGFSLEAQGLSSEPDDRLIGTMAATALSAFMGAHILRVHDVAEARQALAVADAVREGRFIN